MTRHEILGQLNGLQGMMIELIKSVPEADCYQSFQKDLPPLAWLLGRCVYIETYWLREVLQDDGDLTKRVKHLFSANLKQIDLSLIKQLPPLEHLLNWALELQEENLVLLANPKQLPRHPLLDNEHIPLRILQEYALRYEQMLAQLNQRTADSALPYQVLKPMQVLAPSTDCTEMHGGHYRIGAKGDTAAMDNELPPQIVELSSYRMNKRPVSNGAWLGFIEAGGYKNQELWSEAGWQWLDKQEMQHPLFWRQDIQRRWYLMGLNGPSDLVAEDAVSGISKYEAEAYASWVSGQGGELSGAVIQHEYQWESATRTHNIKRNNQVREWCSNELHPYTGYIQPENIEAQTDFATDSAVIRGTSMHSARVLERESYRFWAEPQQRSSFSGTRLVFPPSDMPWH